MDFTFCHLKWETEARLLHFTLREERREGVPRKCENSEEKGTLRGRGIGTRDMRTSAPGRGSHALRWRVGADQASVVCGGQDAEREYRPGGP